MTRGKNICNQLKAVRRNIADENNILLEIEECTYKGECRGTCPRCEAEVRFLENALADRIRLGKVATVAGIALGLASTAQAQTPVETTIDTVTDDTIHKAECCGTLKGTVFDIKTNEPLPFCRVTLLQSGKQVLSVATDFDGIYTIRKIPFGDYTLHILSPYTRQPFNREITINKIGFTVMDVGLTTDSGATVVDYKVPVIEIGTPGGLPSSSENCLPKEAIGEIQVKLPGTPASQAEPTPQKSDIETNDPLLRQVGTEGVKVIVR